MGYQVMSNFDVCWCKLYYEDKKNTFKVRPVIILDDKNALIIKLTTNANRLGQKGEYLLLDWNKEGLNKPSIARLTKIIKLRKSTILNYIGHLSDRDVINIKAQLKSNNYLNNVIIEKLEIHDTLNKNIWNDDMTLRSDVESKLYDIIDEFVEDSNFLTIDDIITANIVGSNASYNYTDNSDLDLHLVVDFSSLSDDEKFVGYASDGERIIFNRRYDIDINGVNAEIYVEDIKSLPVSNGIYDLFKGEWVKRPIKLNPPKTNNKLYSSIYSKKYDDAMGLLDSADTSKDIQKFINQLYVDRRNSLAKDGEAGIENQVFKDIRNCGLLDKLKDKYYELRSQELSLNSVGDEDATQLESILLQTRFGQKF